MTEIITEFETKYQEILTKFSIPVVFINIDTKWLEDLMYKLWVTTIPSVYLTKDISISNDDNSILSICNLIKG